MVTLTCEMGFGPFTYLFHPGVHCVRFYLLARGITAAAVVTNASV